MADSIDAITSLLSAIFKAKADTKDGADGLLRKKTNIINPLASTNCHNLHIRDTRAWSQLAKVFVTVFRTDAKPSRNFKANRDGVTGVKVYLWIKRELA